VRLLPVRIASNVNGGTWAYWSTVAAGIRWAVDHGARVINISYVGLATDSGVQAACQYAHDHDALVVACAGNNNRDPGWPSSPNLILVAGTNQTNNRASFSDFGNFVACCAPATSIYTTTRGGGYGWWQGTSFAAPLTCGVLALMAATNPALNCEQLRQCLLASADDLGAAGYDPYYGYGKINAYRAVQLAQATVGVPLPPPSTGGGKGYKH
jgi:thermitase